MIQRITRDEFTARLAKAPRKAKRIGRRKPNEETAVQRGLLEALAATGVWAIRINALEVHRDCPKCGSLHIKQGEPGLPDIWTEYGWIETKTKSGVLSPSQKRWHAKAKARGVNVGAVCGIRAGLGLVAFWKEQRG